MPVRVLEVYLAALPKLQAERALLAAQSTSVGLGLKPESREGVLAGWLRILRPVGGTRVAKSATTLARLARASGIGFRVAKGKGKRS